MLESILDSPVDVFAYPNGKPGQDYDSRATSNGENGFRAAVSTAPGVGRVGDDLFSSCHVSRRGVTNRRGAGRLALNRANRWLDVVSG